MTEAKKKPSVFDDIEKLRLAPDSLDGAGVEREVEETIPVGRPPSRPFFRVNADPKMSLETTVIIDKEEMRNDIYLVAPEMRAALAGDLRPALLVPVITRQGVLMIWPLPLPLGGRPNRWHERARIAAERAKRRWVRMVADVPAGTYRIFEATADLPEPIWPEKPINELLDVAFAGKVIDDDNHPFVQELLGRK
jgi:hypothetical protein